MKLLEKQSFIILKFNIMQIENKGQDLKVTLDNFDVSYDDIGEGSVPIVFLHGFPFDKTTWQPQMDALKSSHRVIAYDIRGFGKSTDEDSQFSIDLFANDLKDFLEKLNIEKAVICGLSMGGYIALNAFEKFPELFEALILSDTQCIADTKEAQEKRYKTIDEIKVEGTTKFNEGFIKSVFHKDTLVNEKNTVEQLKKVVDANSKHIITQGLVAIAERSETCSKLNEIDIPVLILCGRQDEVTPLKQSEAMHAAIDGSKLCIIENAGHVSNLEQPQIFNKHLLAFLKDLGDSNFNKINGKQRMV